MRFKESMQSGKPIGLRRKLDELGRLVPPSEIRRALDIEPKDEVEFIPYENGFFVRKVEEK